MEPESMYKRGNEGLRWDTYRWDKLDRDEARSKWVAHTGSKIGWINNQLIEGHAFTITPSVGVMNTQISPLTFYL